MATTSSDVPRTTAEQSTVVALWCLPLVVAGVPLLFQAGIMIMLILIPFPLTLGYVAAGGLLFRLTMRRSRHLGRPTSARGLGWTWAWIGATAGGVLAGSLSEMTGGAVPFAAAPSLLLVSLAALLGLLADLSRLTNAAQPSSAAPPPAPRR